MLVRRSALPFAVLSLLVFLPGCPKKDEDKPAETKKESSDKTTKKDDKKKSKGDDDDDD